METREDGVMTFDKGNDMDTAKEAITTLERIAAPLNGKDSPAVALGGVRFYGPVHELFAALAQAQGEFQPIKRTASVQVSSSKANYDFEYAPLENILAATVPALSKYGLSFSQPFASNSDGGFTIWTILAHKSGAMMATETRVPAFLLEEAKVQVLGSALTYLKRYQANGTLGVAAEDDDDGNAADGNQRTIQPRSAARPPQRAPEPPKAPELSSATDAAIGDAMKKLGWTHGQLVTKVKAIGLSLPLPTEEAGQKLLTALRAEWKAQNGGAA